MTAADSHHNRHTALTQYFKHYKCNTHKTKRFPSLSPFFTIFNLSMKARGHLFNRPLTMPCDGKDNRQDSAQQSGTFGFSTVTKLMQG